MAERGFVLPLVLIILALLTLLAMGLSHMASIKVQQVMTKKQQFEGYVNVQNATQTALFRLLTAKPGPRAFTSGDMVVPVDDSPVRLAGLACHIQDVAGLLSLGQYDERRFRLLLQQLVDKKTAVRLAARLGDWLDEDSRQRYQGMEAADYVAAGSAILPRNGPLRSLDELLEIPGFTPSLFNGDKKQGRPGLRDLLIAGGAGWFNAASAPELLLKPYLGVTDRQAAAIVRARNAGDWARFNEGVRGGGISYWEISPDTPSRTFRMDCQAGADLTARVQVQLKSIKDPPYFIQIWQYPDYERY